MDNEYHQLEKEDTRTLCDCLIPSGLIMSVNENTAVATVAGYPITITRTADITEIITTNLSVITLECPSLLVTYPR